MTWSASTGTDRLNQSLERVQSDVPAVQSVFTQTFSREAAIKSGNIKSPLSGALVSVKDLFDVEGYVTRAGTEFMKDDSPATHTAPPVQQLRDAGALLVGHTNMTELAYSGLGINPHYGTPQNVLYPSAVPGGSTAGGAVSVALGLADIAVGTDTGGSVRIPAAFNGIVGFKPTQATVSREGCKSLSHSLDSVGPLAKNVSTCRLAYHSMRQRTQTEHQLSNPTLIIPENFGLSEMDPEVETAFNKAVDALDNANFRIEKRHVPVLETLKSLPAWHYASVEARTYYEKAYDDSASKIDPRVRSRLARADDVTATEYFNSLLMRESVIRDFQTDHTGQILLMPTCPILPPGLKALLDDDVHYHATNLLVLRNPSAINVLNGCSISLPFKHDSTTLGIMLSAPAFHDDSLLAVAQHCEFTLKHR